jgi:hypothetical protein
MNVFLNSPRLCTIHLPCVLISCPSRSQSPSSFILGNTTLRLPYPHAHTFDALERVGAAVLISPHAHCNFPLYTCSFFPSR